MPGLFCFITSWLFVSYKMFFSACEDYVNNIHLNILNKVSGLLSNDLI